MTMTRNCTSCGARVEMHGQAHVQNYNWGYPGMYPGGRHTLYPSSNLTTTFQGTCGYCRRNMLIQVGIDETTP